MDLVLNNEYYFLSIFYVHRYIYVGTCYSISRRFHKEKEIRATPFINYLFVGQGLETLNSFKSLKR